MQNKEKNSLRDLLEQQPTTKLDEMLRAELNKETTDPNSVQMILDILEEREMVETTQMIPQTEVAWETYQKRLEESALRPKPVKLHRRRWLVATVATIMLVVTFLVPMRAEAETLWEMLVRWQNSILEFIGFDEKRDEYEYTFQTDNEGLQQIYDAVLELGVEEPLIPTWIEDYGLTYLEVTNTPLASGVVAELTAEDKRLAFRVDIYDGSSFHGYCGEESYYESYEKEGAAYRITHNLNKWVVVWSKDNVEYFLTLDCQEDTLRRILASIYVMEE